MTQPNPADTTLPVPPGSVTDAEAIAVAGVDAGAAIDVLAAESRGPDVDAAVDTLKALAAQIAAALAAVQPPEGDEERC